MSPNRLPHLGRAMTDCQEQKQVPSQNWLFWKHLFTQKKEVLIMHKLLVQHKYQATLGPRSMTSISFWFWNMSVGYSLHVPNQTRRWQGVSTLSPKWWKLLPCPRFSPGFCWTCTAMMAVLRWQLSRPGSWGHRKVGAHVILELHVNESPSWKSIKSFG